MKNPAAKQHLPCWTCSSSDAAALYLDGKPRVKCFSCGEITYDEEIVEEYMVDSKPVAAATTLTPIKPFEQKGLIHALEDRGITVEVAQKYGVKTTYDNQGKRYSRSFPYFDVNGEIIGAKIKTLDKKIYSEGEIGKAVLFGQQLYAKGASKYITITEGEEDAMAAFQMLSTTKYDSPVVSIKNGAQSAVSNIEQNYEFLNSFDNIIICFDNDEQGKQAAKKVASRFVGKAKIMKMSMKDANDYLISGQAQKFVREWWNSETVSVKGVYEVAELWDVLTEQEKHTTVPYPWEGLNEKTYGMRTGEFTIITAKPKIGKTELLREIIWHIHETTEHHCGVILLEENLKRIVQGFITKDMGVPVHLPDSQYSEEDFKESFDKIADAAKIHIFDPTDDKTAENLFSKLQYFVNAKKCKFIFLDHISMFAYKADTFDERRFLDSFVSQLSDFATANDVHICAVMHVNDDGKTRGSRAPIQLCNTMLNINRDKLNDDPVIANTTTVVVEENRFTGDSGFACDLYYDRETGRMKVLDEDTRLSLLGVEDDEEKTVQFGEE